MTGMKEGTGDDPFADDANPSTPVENGEASDQGPPTGRETAEIPYVLQRETVKEGRNNEHVAFLRDEYADLEDEIHNTVADEMGMRQKEVPLLDLREALLELAGGREGDLADILLSWGHEYRSDQKN